MGLERRCVYYSGRVQGVGFRFTARHLARGFDVAGYVRNLPDGRVELVAEGDAADVGSFFASVRREMGDKVRDADESSEAVEVSQLSGFEIRY
ncbi:MAG: acylphosphatase [Isosphaeraceae bacterium]|nr:acylphosphatase [Isosphaeraceae bacterium]